MDYLKQQSRLNKYTRLVVLACSSFLMLSPQLAQPLSEFEQWKQQYLGEFKKFKDERDRDFADFLNQKWKSFDTETGKIRDKNPKPIQIPIAAPKPKVEPTPAQPIIEPAPVPDSKPQPVPPAPAIIPVVIPQAAPGKTVKLVFIGHSLSIADGVSKSITPFRRQVSQQTIQLKFTELAQSEYPKTIVNLQNLRSELRLNDWGYLQLIQQFSKSVSVSRNNQNVLSWFLLIKSGLNTRVAFGNNQVFLLAAVKQALYDISFFNFDGHKYYVVSTADKLPGQLTSYNGHYPKQLALSDFSFNKAIGSKQDRINKRFNFSFEGKSYQLAIPYNSNTLEFLSTYPQMDIDQYFRTPLGGVTANALLNQLNPMIKGRTEQQAVNFLLRFVQTAFKYQTDGDQFGRENYLFIEETIFYPASDCEDRSILFAWLVKNLLHLEVVGLDFPGHIATAVRLKKPLGTAIIYQNRRFTIADPTYINASAGMKMPQYKKINPKVIPIL